MKYNDTVTWLLSTWLYLTLNESNGPTANIAGPSSIYTSASTWHACPRIAVSDGYAMFRWGLEAGSDATGNRIAARLSSGMAFQSTRTKRLGIEAIFPTCNRLTQSSFRSHESRKIISLDGEIGPVLREEAATIAIASVSALSIPHVRSTWKDPGYCFRARNRLRSARRALIPRVWNSLRFDGPRRLLAGAALPRTGSRRIARPATK